MVRIRVLEIIPTLDQSGAEKQFATLASRLPRDRFDVHCVALTRAGPYSELLRSAGVPLKVLHKRLKFDPVCWLRLRRLIAEIQPDVVHSWLFAANAYMRLATGRQRPPAVVVSERCVDSWKAGWQKWLDRRLISVTDRLVANATCVAEFYQDLGYPQDQIVTIPNGVEIPAVNGKPCGEQTQSLRQELGVPEHTRLVGYVGRLARQKRIRDIIWSMQLLQQLTEDVHFVIVGEGPEDQAIDELLEQFDVRSLVHRLGHRADATAIIGQLDTLWLASDFEGQSNSIMEAMAAGVPVVCTDIAPNRELVRDGQTGFVVPVGDCPGFAQFTDRILADQELAQRLGSAARARMQSDFSVQTMVDRHAELYESLT